MSPEEVTQCRVSPFDYKKKPKLLELADAIAYFATKSLCFQQFRTKQKYIEVFQHINPLQIQFTQHKSNGSFGVDIKKEVEDYLKY